MDGHLSKTEYKIDTKKKILSNIKLSKEDNITMFNNLVQKNLNKNIPDQNTYDWIKEESLTPFSADLRRFSSMLNKTLKNYNQSNNYTTRNISMNEPNNDLSDFTLRDISLNNSGYSIKDPSLKSLIQFYINQFFKDRQQRQQVPNDQYQIKLIEK
ncbi:unnamed protein product [Brachionus calyciflorus]|uniref:Uncharacterized protein n=1 Tax=Brachionus calyciflorus TaxID=104777 RepID=A0A814Q9C3_9BILA|nr:unnamed protein product [Brachionus calyciflorus]